MVVNGAHLNSAWKLYVPSYTNRFGSRETLKGRSVFTEEFFQELQNLPVQKKSRKWTKIWSITILQNKLYEHSHGHTDPGP